MTASSTGDVLARMQDLIRYQVAANTRVSLSEVARLDGNAYRVHPRLLAFFVEEREGILQVLEDDLADEERSRGAGLVHLFLAATQSFLYRDNQFLSLSPQDQEELTGLYITYLSGMAEIAARDRDTRQTARLLKAVIAAHLARLKAFIARLEEAHSVGGVRLIENAVVCEQYTPTLQLEVLGIALDTLREPILDVGCGYDGGLVYHLRAAGLEAYGIDRLVAPSPYLQEADWLTYPYEPSAWGTVLSHRAFSNHFVFHHLYRRGRPEEYANAYMAILCGLREGGAFHYTPGLPFVERFLPEEYRVTLKPVHLDASGRLPAADFYSTRIVRRAAGAAVAIALSKPVDTT
ncbi:MAG: methyltransferase domain-containing protein [Anaerolineae bacterium]